MDSRWEKSLIKQMDTICRTAQHKYPLSYHIAAIIKATVTIRSFIVKKDDGHE